MVREFLEHVGTDLPRTLPVALCFDKIDVERGLEGVRRAAKPEGPVVAIRVYRLINRASGSRRLTAPVQRTLNRVSTAAI